MLKLIQSGLFGRQLHHVGTARSVQRYNACLEDIGLQTTKLTEFHIDGWGWSPEIAEELQNKEYLSHGSANPYSVIISPEQQHCSLYYPYHSFDWDIHQQVFEQYAAQIADFSRFVVGAVAHAGGDASARHPAPRALPRRPPARGERVHARDARAGGAAHRGAVVGDAGYSHNRHMDRGVL